MNGDEVAGKAAAAPKGAPAREAPGRGLKTLVNKAAAPAEAGKVGTKSLVPAWFYFTADLMLLAFTVVVLMDSPFPLHLGEVVFCMASIAVAALFGVMGVRASATQQGAAAEKSSGETRNGSHRS